MINLKTYAKTMVYYFNKSVWIKVLVVICAFIIYTIFVNCIFMVPSKFSIAGDDGDWIAYNGSVLGALISIGVIALTLGQNQKLHEEQRKDQNKKHEELKRLQLSILAATENRVVYNNLINTISELSSIINVHVNSISKNIVYKSVNEEEDFILSLKNEYNSLIKSIDKLYFKIEILIISNYKFRESDVFLNDLRTVVRIFKNATRCYFSPNKSTVYSIDDEIYGYTEEFGEPISGYNFEFSNCLSAEDLCVIEQFTCASKNYLMLISNQNSVSKIDNDCKVMASKKTFV